MTDSELVERLRRREDGVIQPDELIREVTARLEQLAGEVERLRGALELYGGHMKRCIRSDFEAGQPTADGGYEMKYRSTWYRVSPVDVRPPCDCGFDAASIALGERKQPQ